MILLLLLLLLVLLLRLILLLLLLLLLLHHHLLLLLMLLSRVLLLLLVDIIRLLLNRRRLPLLRIVVPATPSSCSCRGSRGHALRVLHLLLRLHLKGRGHHHRHGRLCAARRLGVCVPPHGCGSGARVIGAALLLKVLLPAATTAAT